MSPTIEVDVDERHAEMYEALVDEFGREYVEAEYTALVQRSIYTSLYGGDS